MALHSDVSMNMNDSDVLFICLGMFSHTVLLLTYTVLLAMDCNVRFVRCEGFLCRLKI